MEPLHTFVSERNGRLSLTETQTQLQKDLDVTMTRVGSPLWTAPEVLAGSRYSNCVDTYSLGVVLFEIVARRFPYRKQIADHKKQGAKGMNMKLFKDIALGRKRPDLEAELACKEHGVGLSFMTRRSRYEPVVEKRCQSHPQHTCAVFHECVAFLPAERPKMWDVARRLQSICEQLQARPEKGATSSPSIFGGTILAAMQTFSSRVGDSQGREKLQELRNKVGAILGNEAIDDSIGVYNSPRLYRFLLGNQMDTIDATSKVVLNSKARAELRMDSKRKHIASEDLGFATIPRAAEFRKYVQSNPFAGRAKDGRIVDYHCLGAAVNVEGLQKAFSVKDCTELLLYNIELSRILLDAMSAVEGRNISYVTFFDCSDLNLDKLLRLMDCELLVPFA